MLLAIDIGNTQTSFGLFHNQDLRFQWNLDTHLFSTGDSFLACLYPLFSAHELTLSRVSFVAVSSVVPEVDRALNEFVRVHLKKPLFHLDDKSNLGFHLEVEQPSEVGADRLANARFACEKMKRPAVVVDFGTATTFDLITEKDGRLIYHGGVILPGVRIALSALSSKTSKLSSVDLKFPESVIGRNTTDCIQSGLLYGYCDQIDGLILRIESEIGESCEVALTGGLGTLFQDRLKHPSTYIPWLTLEGIRLVYERRIQCV